MSISVKNIVEGHKNEFLGKNEEMFASRLSVCQNCPDGLFSIIKSLKFVGPWCNAREGGCGCRLNAKLRVAQEHCPRGYWLAIDNEGVEIPFEESLKEKERINKD